MAPAPKGKLIVLSAPSGAGKTTIAHEMLRRFPALSFSISATTRPKRQGEIEGKDYFFLQKEEFLRWLERDQFVEWEEIYGNYYGTPISEIDRAAAERRPLLFDVDVKGGMSIKKRFPHAMLIFVRPPSLEVLARRLRDRNTEDDATFTRRMARVEMEMELGTSFDTSIVNDDLARAEDEAGHIIQEYLSA